MTPPFRIGFGVDSHAFEKTPTGKVFKLGGVVIPTAPGVDSHSDGDLILHSLFNALSSAIGEKSIGEYFPDTKEENSGRDSEEFIRLILKKIHDTGFEIGNVVFSLECKRPKISPHALQIKQNVARLLNVAEDAISVHATTGEGLTSFGKGEGVYCQAVVLLTKN